MNVSSLNSGDFSETKSTENQLNIIQAEILLPLPLEGTFSYKIPDSLYPEIREGQGVRVPFGGRKMLTGIIKSIQTGVSDQKGLREIASLIDSRPMVNETQLNLWSWMSSYYLCSEGEVMKASISAGLKPERKVNSHPHEVTIILQEKYREAEILSGAMTALQRRAPGQAGLLNRFLKELKDCENGEYKVKKSGLIHSSGENAFLKSLVEKDFLRIEEQVCCSPKAADFTEKALSSLSPAQEKALEEIKLFWEDKQTVLLHGVTSSGKTEIYLRLIEEAFSKGNQVLFLLPEISITAQMLLRLKSVFGARVRLFHSKHNESERTELWWDLIETEEPFLVLGARSAVFLPFSKLGLVIVDEEHESSYKQSEPNPRYQARDTAIMLAKLHGAKVLLGSATPSVETLYNAKTGKYGWTRLQERFSNTGLPSIEILDVLKAKKQYRMKHPLFHPDLLKAISETLERKEQVLVFQNRRGFSTFLQCTQCGEIPHCRHCDVTLTWHKQSNRLVCHYCGFSVENKGICPRCHQPELKTGGTGTEKIEEELNLLFPEARIARIDTDAIRTSKQWEEMIRKIEMQEVDILVGTQMISKGLDFGNITLTAIVNADLMLNYPDFKAHEKSFQMMTQVGGRSGRRERPGLVLIQSMDAEHQVLDFVRRYDQNAMLACELKERKTYGYPPFVRLIRISIKHREPGACRLGAETLAGILRAVFKNRVLGPESPLIERMRGLYYKEILLKIEPELRLDKSKQWLKEQLALFRTHTDSKGIRIIIDVDP